MNVKDMLDNAACAGQSRDLLQSSVRGAVLRSIVEWMTSHPKYDCFYHDCFVDALEADPEYDK
jgi:hypothetical protein